MWLWLVAILLTFVNSGAILGAVGQTLEMAMPGFIGAGGARVWAIGVAVLAALILIVGSYQSLEKTLVVLVSAFTFLTLVCTVLLRPISSNARTAAAGYTTPRYCRGQVFWRGPSITATPHRAS